MTASLLMMSYERLTMPHKPLNRNNKKNKSAIQRRTGSNVSTELEDPITSILPSFVLYVVYLIVVVVLVVWWMYLVLVDGHL